MVLSIILTSSFQIKEFTEIQSLQNLEMPQMNLDQKPERKRDKIKKGIRKVSKKLQNVSENIFIYCKQDSFKSGVRTSLLFTTGFGLLFFRAQLSAMAQDNFLYQGKEGMYPLPEKSRLAYMKTWISPRAWKSYLSTGQLSPEFKGFLSSASAASVTLVPFVAGSAVGILVGTAGGYLFTKSAIQIYIIKHNAIVRLASSELDGRNHALSNCALNVVNLSKYLDKHGYLGPTYLNPVKVEESLKEVLANQTNFIKEFIWEVKK